jgi:hypothetical protein
MHAIIRTQKHKSIQSLQSREAHTYRKRETPNADPARKSKNKLLFGREDYAIFCDDKLKNYEQAGNKIRKDGVLAIEYLLTASPEFFTGGPLHDRQSRLKKWGESQVDFLKKMHGEENILCIYLHLDEKTPHIEAYILPIDPKGKLNCKHFLGSPSKLSKLQTDYAKHNERFGLSRGVQGSRANHEEVKNFYADIQQAPKVTKREIINALIISPPGMKDLLNPTAYIKREQKRISENINRLFSGMAQEAKLVRRTKDILLDLKRQEDFFSKKEYEWEKRVEHWNQDRAELVDRLMGQEKLRNELAEVKQYAEDLSRQNIALTAELKRRNSLMPQMKLTPETSRANLGKATGDKK